MTKTQLDIQQPTFWLELELELEDIMEELDICKIGHLLTSYRSERLSFLLIQCLV